MNQIDDSFNSRMSLAMKAAGGSGIPPSRTLFMHFDGGNDESFSGVLASKPPNALMFRMIPRSCAAFAPERRVEAASKGALVEEFDMSGLLRERLFGAVDAIHAIDAKVSADAELPKESVKWLQEALQDAFEKRNNRMRSWQSRLRCAIANLPAIASPGRLELPSFDPLVPVLVCGAGPSLNSQLDALREAQGKAVIVCAGRAAKLLLQAGVKPDFVADVEQNAQLYWDSSLNFDGVLVAHESAHPSLARSFEKFIWTDSGANPLRKLMASFGVALPSIPASGPVASVQLAFAIVCGAKRIGLCGYDLSVAPDGKAYADGKGGMDEGLSQAVKTSSVAGGFVDTLPHFEAMRRDVECALDVFRRAGILFEVFNCSPWGAMIKGSMPMTLKGFVDTFCKYPKTVQDKFAPPAKEFSSRIEEAVAGAAKELAAFDPMLSAIGDINAGLAKNPPDEKLEREAEARLETAAKREVELRVSVPGAELSISACEQAQMLSEQWPRSLTGQGLDAKRAFFRRMGRQCALHRGLLADALNDLKEVFDADREKRFPEIDPHYHPALRAHAASFIKVSNPELASLVEHMPANPSPSGFEKMSRLLSPPLIVSMKSASGEEIRLAEPNSYVEQIQSSVTQLLKDSAFNPVDDAAALCGHVNWGLASEISFRSPNAKLMIVYPWLDLLISLAGSCEFMGLLPEGTVLVCPSESCPGWKEALAAGVDKMKRTSKRILLFENEATSSLPEMQAARAALKEILARG